ncbi:hypothetical protein ACFPVY_04050 [Flavobacterium qiangtangense]|uniref:Uncharacterized protein n=1 Tax=Flavobacterium qiangtangense TaxID=1442595 RepID=A0ABW1PKI4_9FLAO
MACESLSRSRNLPCKIGFSGIKAVGFLNYTPLTLASEDIYNGLGLATQEIYRYELKNDGNTYEEDGVSDRNTSTTVYTGALTIVLPLLDRATRDEVKKMAYGRPQIFLELFDGQVVIAGFEHGCELTSAKFATGGARKDMNGITLTFNTEEKQPLVFVGPAGITAYQDAINSTDVITPGTGFPSGS